jgi:hypothetical protein
MAKKKSGLRCSKNIWKVIEKVRAVNEKDEDGESDIEGYITGAAVNQVQVWGIKHCGITLDDNDALSVLEMLFKIEPTKIHDGEEDIKNILTEKEWKKVKASI